VAIGPLANVAAALELDPGLAARTRLRVVGGNLTSRGFLPPLWPHEFNLAKGRRATRAVLNAPWREIVVYPLDVLRRFRCDAARIERLASAGTVGALLADGSRRWLTRSRWRHGTAGFPVWDLVPALEVSGALAVRVDERTFPFPQRLAFGIPDRVAALTDFDPEEAWRGFDELVLRPRS
jgi:inosine-uridine nucleoside N-ribohydrolase